jgi:N-acetylglucosamine-6-sulfatase
MVRPMPVPRGRVARRRHVRSALGAVVVGVLVLGLVSCTGGHHRPTPASSAGPATPDRPNIVFVLTDDLTQNLLRYMPHVQAMARAGMSFTNYTVTDSLCCPSRASILTGAFPHNTKVYRNRGADGGYLPFVKRGEEQNTFGNQIQAGGYRTGFMGKYLNQYYAGYPAPPFLGTWTPPESTHVPPGWDEWDAVGNGYPQYRYLLNHNHHVVHYGHQPNDYLNTVLQGYALPFISKSVQTKQPFLLEVASFSPHTPSIAAPQDVHKFRSVTAPRGPAYDRLPKNPPSWLAPRTKLTRARMDSIDVAFRKRVQSVQSVDRMVGALQAKLMATGQAANTVFVFSSDNGYHMGDYRLNPGKLTAFDTDIRVPLIVTGPGIAAGSVNDQVTENIDLAPTFEELAGAGQSAEVDGRSLVPLLHGENPSWRTLALVEHHGPDTALDDPDRQSAVSGNPPSYEAIRSAQFTYVRYANGEREYYDRTKDPDELNNLASRLSPARIAQLDDWMGGLQTCVGAAQCWQAARPSGV